MTSEKYIEMRDQCYASVGGELSKEDKDQCQKTAAVMYFKKYGEPAVHEDIDMDEIDLAIAQEQLDVFGSWAEHEKWNDGKK